MISIRSDVNHLVAVLRDELSSQLRLEELLKAQESSVVARTSEALEAATTAIQAELSAAAARRARREQLLRRIGAMLGLAPSALTLRSLAERVGPDEKRLLELRESLRAVAARIVKLNRRIAAAVGLHRRINQEVLECLLGSTDGNPRERVGALVDAEV